MKDAWPKIAVSGTALTVLIVRHVNPGILDLTDLVTIGVVLVPWLSSLIRSAELPGGFKIEFQDLQRAGAKVTGGAAPSHTLPQPKPTFVAISETDPNLALVALRIEVERRLRALAERYSTSEQRSLNRIFRELRERQVLTD